MPFYEFWCQDCQHIQEAFFEMDDDKRVACPNCENKMMQRKYTLGGIVLKGTGWGKDA